MLTKVTNFSQIHHNYNGFIVDIWGVLHDGSDAFPEALECLEELNSLGKRIVLFSNAPRRSASVAQILSQKNISANLYYKIISSGELVFESLKNNSSTQKKYFYIGPERDLGLLRGTDYNRVYDILDAEFIVVTGINENIGEEPFDKGMLDLAIAKKIPLICANPDLYVFKDGKKILCAGSIAEYYVSLKGEVFYYGKPFNVGYLKCQEILNLPKNQILAIGDSYKTDITGACNYGIDSLLISSGVDRDLFTNNDHLTITNELPKPTFIMETFKW